MNNPRYQFEPCYITTFVILFAAWALAIGFGKYEFAAGFALGAGITWTLLA